MTNQNETPLLWHYTDLPGMIGILTKHTLRATSVSFVNDPTEDSLIRNIMLEIIGEFGVMDADWAAATQYKEWKNSTQNPPGLPSTRYVTCTSMSQDDLTMWRTYGGNSASTTIAIGIDQNVPIVPLSKYMHDEQIDKSGQWTSITYGGRDYIRSRAIASLVHLRTSTKMLRLQTKATSTPVGSQERLEYAITLWNQIDIAEETLQASFKLDPYKNENEYRITANYTGNQYEIQPRAAGASTYIELTAADSWGSYAQNVSPIPVREVCVGPGSSDQTIIAVVAALLKGGHITRDNTDRVPVTRSKVPFA